MVGKKKKDWDRELKTSTEKQTDNGQVTEKEQWPKTQKSRKIWTEGCWTTGKEGQAGKRPREME